MVRTERSLSAAAMLTALLFSGATARAAPARVAILEYRSGVTAMSDLPERMAKVLRAKTSLAVDDPTDVRRILGARVDDQVARCSGSPDCIAAIGRALGETDVILIGMSQLGDVVLAMQHIRVSDGSVEGRVAESLPADAPPDDATLEKYLHELLPRSVFLRYGKLVVHSNLDGARVSVNGVTRGVTPLSLTLEAPQSYAVRVEQKGYTPFAAQVDVAPDAEVALAPLLVPASRDAVPVYTRWWFWTGLGAAAAATAAVLVATSSSPPTRVPVTLTWP